jgi:hypothetical protein
MPDLMEHAFSSVSSSGDLNLNWFPASRFAVRFRVTQSVVWQSRLYGDDRVYLASCLSTEGDITTFSGLSITRSVSLGSTLSVFAESALNDAVSVRRDVRLGGLMVSISGRTAVAGAQRFSPVSRTIAA